MNSIDIQDSMMGFGDKTGESWGVLESGAGTYCAILFDDDGEEVRLGVEGSASEVAAWWGWYMARIEESNGAVERELAVLRARMDHWEATAGETEHRIAVAAERRALTRALGMIDSAQDDAVDGATVGDVVRERLAVMLAALDKL